MTEAADPTGASAGIGDDTTLSGAPEPNLATQPGAAKMDTSDAGRQSPNRTPGGEELPHNDLLPEEQLVHIRRGALLHDIGNMGVPDAILLKPDKLTDEEWVVMKKHPEYAHQLLSPISYLRQALDIPYAHHERWDGSGYPRGLKGEEIPLSARLFSVVDVWDALRSDRPYRPGWANDRVLAYLREQSGRHFDPQAVALFLNTVS